MNKALAYIFYFVLALLLFFLSVIATFPFVLLFVFVLMRERYVIVWVLMICVVLISFKNIVLLLGYNFTGSVVGYLELYKGGDFLVLLMLFFVSIISNIYRRAFVIDRYDFIVIMISVFYLLFSVTMYDDVVDSVRFFRMLILPILTLFIARYIFYLKIDIRPVYSTVLYVFLFFVIIELFFEGYHDLINVNNYVDIRWMGERYVDDYHLKSGTQVFGLKIERLLGPRMTPISTGYILSFFYAYLVQENSLRKNTINYFIISLLFMCLTFMASKGAFLIVFILFIIRSYDIKDKGLLIVLVAYTASVIFLLSLEISTSHMHYKTLVYALDAFMNKPTGNWMPYTVEYDTFFGLLLVSTGYVSLLYMYAVWGKIWSQYPFVGDNIVHTYLLFLIANSLIQAEPMTPSGLFLPLLYVNLEALKKINLLSLRRRGINI